MQCQKEKIELSHSDKKKKVSDKNKFNLASFLFHRHYSLPAYRVGPPLDLSLVLLLLLVLLVAASFLSCSSVMCLYMFSLFLARLQPSEAISSFANRVKVFNNNPGTNRPNCHAATRMDVSRMRAETGHVTPSGLRC